MPRAVLYAILVHIALVALLVVSLDWTPKPEFTQARMETVQAELVDASEIRAEQSKRQQEEARLKRLEKEKQAARQREEERKVEEQQEKLKKQQETKALALKKKLDAEKLKKEQEAERIAKLKQEKEIEEKKRKEEGKRLAEEDEKRRRAEERKRRMEAQERELQESLDAEQQGRQAERERMAGAEIGKYTNLIKQKVDRNWLRPQNAREGLSCWLQVRLSPGGEVLVARVTQSSGDVAFDRSAEAAVYKASPLPVPQDASLFDEKFREFKFHFNPGR
ncbi:MAG: cell envelope integrity protein TolA [Gammaproteobacteria bacterium]|nr:cell envelope integrity protein TolA [Gammaproteobacteria bacterium]